MMFCAWLTSRFEQITPTTDSRGTPKIIKRDKREGRGGENQAIMRKTQTITKEVENNNWLINQRKYLNSSTNRSWVTRVMKRVLKQRLNPKQYNLNVSTKPLCVNHHVRTPTKRKSLECRGLPLSPLPSSSHPAQRLVRKIGEHGKVCEPQRLPDSVISEQ